MTTRHHSNLPLSCSPDGTIFGPRGKRIPRLDRYGYLRVNVCSGSKRITVSVHKIVAEIFLGPAPIGHSVNHIDGDKANNRVENLEYVTFAKNTTMAFRAGLVSTCKPVLVAGQHFHSLRECERVTGLSRRKLSQAPHP